MKTIFERLKFSKQDISDILAAAREEYASHMVNLENKAHQYEREHEAENIKTNQAAIRAAVSDMLKAMDEPSPITTLIGVTLNTDGQFRFFIHGAVVPESAYDAARMLQNQVDGYLTARKHKGQSPLYTRSYMGAPR